MAAGIVLLLGVTLLFLLAIGDEDVEPQAGLLAWGILAATVVLAITVLAVAR